MGSYQTLWSFFCCFALALLLIMSNAFAQPDEHSLSYVKAFAALKHAQRHQADKFASPIYRRAEKYFTLGKKHYFERNFEEADQSFQFTVRFAKLSMRKAYLIRHAGSSETKDVQGVVQ